MGNQQDLQAGMATITAQLASIEKKQDELQSEMNDLKTKLFIGNGSPSLMTRVDRLEQSRRRGSMHFGVVYTAVAAALALILIERVFAHIQIKSPNPPTNAVSHP